MGTGGMVRRMALFLLLCLTLCGILAAAQADDSAGMIQVVQSIQRLGMIDASSVAMVWMTDQAATVWSEFAEVAADSGEEAFALFSHNIWLATQDTNSNQIGGLYNPWVGSLIVFVMDPQATLVTASVAILVDTDPLDVSDAQGFAQEAMHRIEQASQRFETIAASGLPESSDIHQVADRVDQAVLTLRWLYGASEDGSDLQTNTRAALDALESGSQEGALSLLRREDNRWVAELYPVWGSTMGTESFVLLSTTEEPLSFVSLRVSGEVSDDPITSVSVIHLFDRLTTRGGDRG